MFGREYVVRSGYTDLCDCTVLHTDQYQWVDEKSAWLGCICQINIPIILQISKSWPVWMVNLSSILPRNTSCSSETICSSLVKVPVLRRSIGDGQKSATECPVSNSRTLMLNALGLFGKKINTFIAGKRLKHMK